MKFAIIVLCVVVLTFCVITLLTLFDLRRRFIQSLRSGVDKSLELIPSVDTSLDLTQVPVKFFVTCICKKSNKANVYCNFVTEDFTLGDPSEAELKELKDSVMKEHPEYVDCTILFFGKLRG